MINGIPMTLDYSKTLNDQHETFEYYKNRYISYELQIIQLNKRISYLERSLNRKENEILDLRNENVEVENCFCNRTDCSSRIKDSKKYDSLVQKIEKQQQEFIDYLKDMLDSDNDIFSVISVKDVLNKYKEIIGTDIRVGSKGGIKDENI